jgi:hypothetical protein
MNEIQRLSKITHIQRLIIALDAYNQKRYPLDLTDSEYELIKEGLEMLKEDLSWSCDDTGRSD